MITTNIVLIIFLLTLMVSLGTIAYRLYILDRNGAIVASAFGFIIGLFGSIYWILLLILFLGLAFLGTKYKFRLKKKKGVAEGVVGERKAMSVIANGAVFIVIALLPLPLYFSSILYITGLSAATADTLASEFGVFSKNTYLITNFKPVTAGTNGGVSIKGELWALLGAVIVPFLGFAVFLAAGIWKIADVEYLFIPIIVGFVGCQIDSVLGAIFENRGFLNKGQVNLIQIGISTILAYIYMLVA